MIIRQETRKRQERFMEKKETEGRSQVLFEFKVRRDSDWIEDLQRDGDQPGLAGLRKEVESEVQREARMNRDSSGEKLLDLGGNGPIDVGSSIEQLLGYGFRPTDACLFDKRDDYLYLRLSMEKGPEETLDYQTFCLVEEFAGETFRYMQMYRNEDNVALTPTILSRGSTEEIVELKFDDNGVYGATTHTI